MFYFLLMLFLFAKNIFWLVVFVSLIILSISLIRKFFSYVFVAVILMMDVFMERRRRKKKDSGIKNEKNYDKTDPLLGAR